MAVWREGAVMPNTFRDRVVHLLRLHAGEWVPWYELAEVGGRLAWRTRVADARKLGMTIENKQTRRPDGTKDSFYRYLPERLF
jgi:hypothetical protein